MRTFLDWICANKGLFIGLCAGLAAAILFLTIGFWATLLIAVCIGAGAFLGTHTHIFGSIADFFDGLINKDRHE